MMPGLILVCIFTALIFLWLSQKQRKQSGLPGGRIISSDTSSWNKLEEPLYSHVLGLTGKPDYVIDHEGIIIPVEVKSSRNPDRGPFDSHIYQLAAYCLLILYVYGKRPPYGVLHYTSRSGKIRTYSIPFSQELEEKVKEVIHEIQSKPTRNAVDRSHHSIAKCKQCGFISECNQSLT